jgi:hypothetical protein
MGLFCEENIDGHGIFLLIHSEVALRLHSNNPTNMSRNPEEPVVNLIEESRSIFRLTRQDLVDGVGMH